MNDSPSPNPRSEPDNRLAQIHRLLVEHLGQPEPREPWDPLTQFIGSLLAPSASADTMSAVVRNLRARFSSWENLRDAPLAEIEQALAAINLPGEKALHLKASLQAITARVGELALDFLARYRTDKIRAWLEQFPGVGPQISAAVVNLSTLRRRALCVDSHHLRVTQRLGLTPRADAATTEERLMRLVPETWSAEMLDEHHQLIQHLGQTLCTFNDPKCPQCPLLRLCPHGQRQVSTQPIG